MRRSRTMQLTSLAAIVAVTATACISAGSDGGGGEGGGQGASVEIFGAFSGDEEELFNESLEPFRQATGIDVQYVASSDFTTLIRSRTQGGDPPDIALFPQPGLVQDLSDELTPLGDVLDLPKLEETLIPGFLDAATGEDGQVYAAPMRMAVKSIVWYPKPEFEGAGYAPVESFEDLLALSDKIVAEGNTPWCIGMESGSDTGWVATDWVEEMVLRTAGPEVYDKWWKHEIPFNDPAIKKAAEAFAKIWQANGYVLGGPQAILTTPFGDAANPMFTEPPGCYMHRQGNFITGFFPEDVQADLTANVGTFYFPAVTEGGFDGKPVLGGGDLAGLFNADNANAVQVMEFITSDEFGGPWAAGGGWLSPHRTFDLDEYTDDTTRRIAELAVEADVFRFDASDLMPAQVGAGTFWTGMIDWISGQKDLDTVLLEIEQSWPTS